MDKTGNTNWAQCPDCGAWFHVSTELIRLATTPLICPECAHRFLPEQAEAMIEVG